MEPKKKRKPKAAKPKTFTITHGSFSVVFH